MGGKSQRAGKLPPDLLGKLVYPYLGVRRPEVLVHSTLGEDSAIIDFGEWVAVVSTDPITGTAHKIGWLAVQVACNDVASNGAEPIGVLVTLLLAENDPLDDAQRIMSEVHAAATDLGIEVLGGHSEVTPGLASPIVSLTAVGRALKSAYVTSSGARVGDSLVITKAAALEGTAILAADFADELTQHLGRETVERAQEFIREISVVPEGLTAARSGATAMHDATEGGVLGAVYELAAASGVGVELWRDRIPVRRETHLVCDRFGLDPLKLVSSGTMVITSPDGPALVEKLSDNGVQATIVGHIVEAERVVIDHGHREPLSPPERDELWRVVERA